MGGLYQIRRLTHLTATVHPRRKYGGRDFSAGIVQCLGEDPHRVLWGVCIGILKGDGQDDTLAGKDRLAVDAVPSVKEPLDPKDTIRSS